MKHMKKSMFITTLIMTVVLVVALSTATFAWYTANTAVNTNVVEVYTAQSTAASIVVSSGTYTGPDMDNTTMNLTLNAGTVGSGIQPMMPKTAFVTSGESRTSYTAAKASTFFNYANIGVNGDFLAAGAPTSPAIITSVQATGGSTQESSATEHDYFYVVNTSDAAHTISVNVVFADSYVTAAPTEEYFTAHETEFYTKSGTTYTQCTDGQAYVSTAGTYYTASATLKNALRVAVFADDYCVAVYSVAGGDSAYKYGTITANTASSSFGTAAAGIATGTPTNLTSSTAAYGAVKVSVVAWYEGLAITNAFSGQSAGFNLVFTAA